ncbi:General substrate transporter [Mycena venus]|uniref:General substrate transporter n=1 Tax=Mycena venus TaxID=2733690 RepID=A0A8H6YER9_9AGAR|nr:General substrate transporter [Mycena venus]
MDSSSSAPGLLQNIRVYWLAFVVYWGIVLFGYDTGIAGGVVSQTFFRKHFGLLGPDGKPIVSKTNAISSNVVSVLQAGAFFGALGSAPISAIIGRKWTLVIFTVIFSLGAALTTAASSPVERPRAHLCRARHQRRRHRRYQCRRARLRLRVLAQGGARPDYGAVPDYGRGGGDDLVFYQLCVPVLLFFFFFFLTMGGTDGIGLNLKLANSPAVWQIPFGFQLVPAGLMLLGLFTVKVRFSVAFHLSPPTHYSRPNRNPPASSPRATAPRRPSPISPTSAAPPPTDDRVIHELAEIESAIAEEREARAGLYWKEAFFGKGNFVRFLIAFFIFFLQQWGGQNSVGYYAPQIFANIGFTGTKNSLLASGIYGVVKVVATSIFVLAFVDSLGRKLSLFISALGMGGFFFIIGALLKEFPPPATSTVGEWLLRLGTGDWGGRVVGPARTTPTPTPLRPPKPWPRCSTSTSASTPWAGARSPGCTAPTSSPTRTRHYGLAVASGSQWLWNFVQAKVTPSMITTLGYKIFLMFATINIGAMATFSLIIPETKGRSLEDMDIIFGSTTQEARTANIAARETELDRDIRGDVVHDVDEKV